MNWLSSLKKGLLHSIIKYVKIQFRNFTIRSTVFVYHRLDYEGFGLSYILDMMANWRVQRMI